MLLATNERGITRDQLVAYLWPDSSEERARHALAQLLYGVRKELGEEVVEADALTLRLNPSLLASDVAEFRRAILNDELEKAAELYAGSFLDGFFLSGCDEFERWVEEARNDLAHRAHDVLHTLATRADKRGELTVAADAWRRLARMSPLDSRVALSFMKALVAAGDRAGALEFARVHEALVRSELDSAPDPSIVEFVGQLKSMPVEPSVAASSLTSVTAPPAVVAADGATETPRSVPASSPPEPPRRVAARAERWRWMAPFILGLGTLAAIGAVASLRSQPELPKKWVLIAEAENATGDNAFDRTMPIALSASLSQSTHVYPVPPDRVRQSLIRMRRQGADVVLDIPLAREIAQREGVTAIAVPSAERSGDGFELSVRLIDPATGGVVARSAVRAVDRANVIAALDELGKDVRRQMGESRFSVARNHAYLPLVTTASFDALVKYADGHNAFNTAKYGEANALWSQAVALDSSFASAYASLGMLAYWTNRAGEGAQNFQKALALATNLPEREQLRIRASSEGWRGNRDSAVALLRPYVATHPQDLDMLNMLGYNLLRGRRSEEAEQVLLKVVALDSTDVGAFINLATVQKSQGRYDDALRNYRRAFELDPTLEVANNNVNLEFGDTYIRNDQPDSARATFYRLLSSPDTLRQGRALRSLAFLDMHEGHFHSAADRLAKAATMMRNERSAVSEIRNRILLAQSLEQIEAEQTARVQWETAFDIATRIDAPTPILFWLGKAMARVGDVRRATTALETVRKKAQRDIKDDVAVRELLEGEVLLARGQTQEALTHLRAGYAADSQTHALESLAHAFAETGVYDSSAARYAQMETRHDFGTEAQNFTQLASYWLGRVEEVRKNPQRARDAYARFIDRWKNGDPALPLVVDAKARIARLNTNTQ